MSQLRIERARPEHLGAMKKLCRELIAHLASEGHDAPFLWQSERLEDDMFGPHRCLEAFIAWLDGEAVGYTIATTCYDVEAMRREWQVLDLYVAPHARGSKGEPSIAHQLMDRNLAYARHIGAGQMSGYIYKGNPSMERFCAKFGFAISDKYLSIKMPIQMQEVRQAPPAPQAKAA